MRFSEYDKAVILALRGTDMHPAIIARRLGRDVKTIKYVSKSEIKIQTSLVIAIARIEHRTSPVRTAQRLVLPFELVESVWKMTEPYDHLINLTLPKIPRIKARAKCED